MKTPAKFRLPRGSHFQMKLIPAFFWGTQNTQDYLVASKTCNMTPPAPNPPHARTDCHKRYSYSRTAFELRFIGRSVRAKSKEILSSVFSLCV